MRCLPSLLLLLPLLAGCASLSQEECISGDWSSVGANDAMEGREASRLADHAKACAKYDIVPDKPLYEHGYQKGLGSYCTPTNGFSVGRNGYNYRHICPPASEAEFMRGYLRGSSLHDIETEIAEAEHDLSRIQRERDILRADKKASDKGKRLRQLSLDLDGLRWDLQRLRFKRDRALVEADRFLQTMEPGI
ncbi:DUF2799 domain-containing protein [uncultured Cohaesibacter sp.]|uniref:DUF2799 domain-containing protein n=1 Tax=uncultured Cohaesibacter sp. TaxID=1002546 RepID=UPI0029C82134|nr:DUF2799 domain-containing protein [uncultured Cohaesibacter sp.]